MTGSNKKEDAVIYGFDELINVNAIFIYILCVETMISKAGKVGLL